MLDRAVTATTGSATNARASDTRLEDEPPWYGEDGPEPLRLPRIQEGARPQHLLITLFADFWFGRPDPLPSAALVDLAAEFGISATSARAALSRLGRRGLMSATKVGRRTFYGPTERTKEEMARYRRRIFAFGTSERQPWDGTWLVVAFSVPEEEREQRHALRKRLRWLGFSPLYDGVWVSARPVADEARAVIDECGVRHASVLSSTVLFSTAGPEPLSAPLAAWDLDLLRGYYDDFVTRFDPVRERVARGAVGAAEALVERTAIMDAWSNFPGVDPELPAAVLPADWPRRRAHEIFTCVYDELGPLAEARFRQVVAAHDPSLAELVRHYTTADVR